MLFIFCTHSKGVLAFIFSVTFSFSESDFTRSLPVDPLLPNACSAFRQSADCNTESGGAASNIAGIAVPKLRFQHLFRAVPPDWAVHNHLAGYMFFIVKTSCVYGTFILQKIFRKNQCADCSFNGIYRKRVRTLRFVLSFLPCNAGFCVFFRYCLIHTQQYLVLFLIQL